MTKRRSGSIIHGVGSVFALRIGLFGAAVITSATLFPAPALADVAKVTIPSGPFRDGQIIAVSGSGFPSHTQDPTGLQIIECSDPQGSVANLPTDPSMGCEGITVNASQINTDASGRFRTSYPIAALSSSAGTSSIDCDATRACVLWVGTDYNNAFLSGPHAFTAPFTVTGGGALSPSTTAASASGSPTATSAAPVAATSSADASGASLASTGLPGLTLWLIGLGVALAAVGLLGRRLTVVGVRAPD